jgi:hypothetical protein
MSLREEIWPEPADPAPPPATCARRAWLTMAGRSLPLEDPAAAYYCTELDLGYPDVREVVNNRPDQHGTDDRTALMGAREISASIETGAGGAFTPDEIAALFAPFMVPSARPRLHYVLDRPGAPERVVVVRPAGYAWPVSGKRSWELNLQWVAPDPTIWSAETKTAIAWAGASTVEGRTYDLVFPRIYPAGSAVATPAFPDNAGDLPAYPILRIYGPVTAPAVNVESYLEGVQTAAAALIFQPGALIDPGAYVEVNTRDHTATLNGDPAVSVVGWIDWTATRWPVFAPLPQTNRLAISGSSTSHISQVMAIWREGFLT